eukprot:CAMPEP_0195592342 /NCGR_PEP_ID=MMETSP0815-20121206/301_1 /TAXON_ID=97485 /ORGANISM="Prymnesium parvum, Strain Texoma1" /LENGTH=137 /DNA_ID=CAMNT_0040731411 /DNA_START=236 /DNA_END=645 /DNA_ORIENTATION=+
MNRVVCFPECCCPLYNDVPYRKSSRSRSTSSLARARLAFSKSAWCCEKYQSAAAATLAPPVSRSARIASSVESPRPINCSSIALDADESRVELQPLPSPLLARVRATSTAPAAPLPQLELRPRPLNSAASAASAALR